MSEAMNKANDVLEKGLAAFEKEAQELADLFGEQIARGRRNIAIGKERALRMKASLDRFEFLSGAGSNSAKVSEAELAGGEPQAALPAPDTKPAST